MSREDRCLLMFALAGLLGCILGTSAMAQNVPDSTSGSRSLQYRYIMTGYDSRSYFEEPIAVTVDERNSRILVADVKSSTISVFSTQGIAERRYGPDDRIHAPVAVSVDGKGDLYIPEQDRSSISVIPAKGEPYSIELPVGEGMMEPRAGRMAFDRDSNLYVADTRNCQILVLAPDHSLKMRIGAKGDKRGQFRSLQDIAVDRSGRIYAVDAAGTPVQVFDRKGKYIYRFGFHGDGREDLGYPCAISIDRNDQIWITDRAQHCLKVFDRSGTFLQRLGEYGQEPGKLFQPVDARVDGLGRVYVLESGTRRLQVFSLARPFDPFVPASDPLDPNTGFD